MTHARRGGPDPDDVYHCPRNPPSDDPLFARGHPCLGDEPTASVEALLQVAWHNGWEEIEREACDVLRARQ